MSVIEKFRNSKGFELLFLAWLITLPFGSYIGSISLGFFTLYPNLFFTLILASTSLFSFFEWQKTFKIVALFLLGWLIYAIAYGWNLQFDADVIFDIRSTGMQFLYAVVLFSSFTIIGYEKFIKFSVIGFRCFLIILLVFGLFELHTGTHFSGRMTEFYQYRLDLFDYFAPTFIYDNPNDFLLYTLFILLILLVLDVKLRKNPLLVISVLLIMCVFNSSSNSKLSFISLPLLIGLQGGVLLWKKRQSIRWNNRFVAALSISFVCLILMIANNPIDQGQYITEKGALDRNALRNTHYIVEEGENKIVEIRPYAALSDNQQEKILDYHHKKRFPNNSKVGSKPKPKPFSTTHTLRVNLLLNGFDFIKSEPILGIGPGQFKSRHRNDRVEKDTHTVTGAHNFVIEIISQYGIIGWVYFGFLLYFLFLFIRSWKLYEIEYKAALVSLFIGLPFLWLMPSSYLYLDINWLLLPFLAIVVFNFQTQTDGK